MTRSQTGLSFLSACLLLSFQAHGGEFDWPNWRGPAHDGISKEKGWLSTWPQDGPKQLWKTFVGTGFSSVAVADGRVFTLGNLDGTDTIYCFDAESGRELWKHSYACPLDPTYYEGGPGSTPTVESNRVYTLSKRGHVFCLKVTDGKTLWERNLIEDLRVEKPRWGFAGSPLVASNLLVLNVGEAGTAVDKLTGKIVWHSATNAPATPRLSCFAGMNGAPSSSPPRRWWPCASMTDKNSGAIRGNPLGHQCGRSILIGEKLFVSTFDRGCALLRLSATGPSAIGENKEMANHFNSCVFLNGGFFGIHGNTDQAEKDLRCLDVATGEVKWKFAGLGLGSLMAADNKLIVLSDKGELLAAPAATDAFKPSSRAQVLGGKCWTVPVLSNGRIYCRNAQGDLVCLDVRARGVAGAGR
jgi:outer membrane protein assembly factor BamB